ncbi:MAG: hypothetical protein OEM15_11935 [Myxococcales bacterium]|nr:hypothetical protein [Myxococcales bacterium]MDH3484488.1 hypothetical protein [Myxococcales bacterium]
MSEKAKAPFETVRAGCARFTPSLEVLLARWAAGCDESPHTSATHILKESGFSFVSLVGKLAGTYAQGFACPHCGAKEAAERGEAPTPSCFLTGGQYRASGQSNPRSLQCRSCGRVTKPSALVEHLYPSKPKRLAFLQQHCGGAKPQEQRWTAARHDGAVAVAGDAESAMDRVAPDTFPPEMELCLLLGIEQPIDAADLELPYVAVALSERGEIKTLGWHGERPSMDEQARYHTWHRAAARERQKEIERRTRLVTAELEREVPLQ